LNVRPGRNPCVSHVRPPSPERANPMSLAPPLKNRPTWNAPTTVLPAAKVSGCVSHRAPHSLADNLHVVVIHDPVVTDEQHRHSSRTGDTVGRADELSADPPAATSTEPAQTAQQQAISWTSAAAVDVRGRCPARTCYQLAGIGWSSNRPSRTAVIKACARLLDPSLS
jgi:hypothetical protein